MFKARAFWMTRLSAGLFSGVGPPAFTAIAISFPMRANCFDIRSQRRNIVAFRVSKMRPIQSSFLRVRSSSTGGGISLIAILVAKRDDAVLVRLHFHQVKAHVLVEPLEEGDAVTDQDRHDRVAHLVGQAAAKTFPRDGAASH